MRAGLAVNVATPDLDASLAQMRDLVCQAAGDGADLVLFGEAAPTGLINNGDPGHDLPLGDPVPGTITQYMADVARHTGAYIAFGLLERERQRLYDSAVLLDPAGRIVLRYRRIQPQWHGRKADPEVYQQGCRAAKAVTPLGTMAFLLCGDLFDNAIVARVRRLRPNYLLFPFSRSFSDGSWDQQRWDSQEEPQYAARATRVGCTTLMVNVLQDKAATQWAAFGGAMVVSAGGVVLKRQPLGRPGVLVVDV